MIHKIKQMLKSKNNNDTAHKYQNISKEIFGETISRDLREVVLHSIYKQNSEWFNKCHRALLGIEHEYTQELIKEIKQFNILGAFAEFGIFQGTWINLLYEMTENAGLNDRNIYGFDSFKGLSEPHRKFDSNFWKKGMYASPKSEVEKNVRANERPRIKLIEGFFNTSLKSSSVKDIGKIAFARIDCDIYEPAKECLDFLSNRLTHNAVLVFDDWSHSFEYGESLAFYEWLNKVPNLSFKFLFCGPWGHLYLRVLHKDKVNNFSA